MSHEGAYNRDTTYVIKTSRITRQLKKSKNQHLKCAKV